MEDFTITIVETQDLVHLEERAHAWRAFPYRKIGRTSRHTLRLAVHEDVLQMAHQHAAAYQSEIGGILIGDAYTYHGRIWVAVNAILEANIEDSSPIHVTFSPDVWMDLFHRQQTLYAGQLIVGWYHSHPNMGIFLSAMDLAVHHAFFKAPWQIAMVINGQNQRMGFFGWQEEWVRPLHGFSIFKPVEGNKAMMIKRRENYFTYRPPTVVW